MTTERWNLLVTQNNLQTLHWIDIMADAFVLIFLIVFAMRYIKPLLKTILFIMKSILFVTYVLLKLAKIIIGIATSPIWLPIAIYLDHVYDKGYSRAKQEDQQYMVSQYVA
jgi:hypothetical protein